MISVFEYLYTLRINYIVLQKNNTLVFTKASTWYNQVPPYRIWLPKITMTSCLGPKIKNKKQYFGTLFAIFSLSILYFLKSLFSQPYVIPSFYLASRYFLMFYSKRFTGFITKVSLLQRAAQELTIFYFYFKMIRKFSSGIASRDCRYIGTPA